MKLFLTHTITLILAVCCSKNSYAVTDSLPSCIDSIRKKTAADFTEYEYKGQRWFVIAPKAKTPAPNYPDRMVNIKFYDSTCKLVCTWTKGGIAGFNKVAPDTIEKEKIIAVVAKKDSIVVKTNQIATNLPDSIAKTALLKKSNWIEENKYQGNSIFRFQNPADNPNTSTITFVNPYFDENGKVTIKAKITGQTFWWHQVNGKFLRTQFRPGYR